MSYLTFTPDGTSPSGKTKRWGIKGSDGSLLGVVSWYAPWRRYTAQLLTTSIFDATCFREVADFIENETKRHKENL